MDLRNLPDGLSPEERCALRRSRAEESFGIDLSALTCENIGTADEKNCEQMFGMVGLPVGYAGPLRVAFSDGTEADVHLPLATTEGALVASVNRGCKALAQAGVKTTSIHHGITRSLCFEHHDIGALEKALRDREAEWKKVAEGTSSHLKVLGYDIDSDSGFVFLTIAADTDEAMGMNMVTIAAQAVGDWVAKELKARFVTVAGNVDSDKKPSRRTMERGRGYEVKVRAELSPAVIESVLKTTPDAMLKVATAKLEHGSALAGALSVNLHAANIVAALYLATGQDAAHVVEGSLADTVVEMKGKNLKIAVRVPALLVGVHGGGTALPGQSQCLAMLLKTKTSLHPCAQLAESIGAAVLAGELSLLAAQAGHELASSHKELGR